MVAFEVESAESTRFFQKPWFMWLALIFLAPIGIFLMWKYSKLNGAIKIILSIVFGTFFIMAITPSSKNEYPAPSNDGGVSKPAIQLIKPDEAKKIDKQIWEALLLSEKIHAEMTKASAQYANGQISKLDFYDICKTVESYQSQFNYPAKDEKGAEKYRGACEKYSVRSYAIANNLVKYLDKGEMKYLSEAKTRLESMNDMKLNITSERMKYLSNAGLSEEEISEILEVEKAE